MTAIDAISQDLDWREKEIASMRVLLSSPSITRSQKSALFRAAWAMLYAHYEGFIKNTLTIFFDEVERSTNRCELLPFNTKVFALQETLKSMKNLAYDNMLVEIEKFQNMHYTNPPKFPNVDTKSNLWPNILINLLKIADLDITVVEKNEAKLKTLVSRRNSIAHGEKNFINELSYFHGFEESVYDVLYDIALQVDSRLSQPPYQDEAQ